MTDVWSNQRHRRALEEANFIKALSTSQGTCFRGKDGSD